MCAALQLKKEILSNVRLQFFNQFKRRSLIDTGSFANALPGPLFKDPNI